MYAGKCSHMQNYSSWSHSTPNLAWLTCEPILSNLVVEGSAYLRLSARHSLCRDNDSVEHLKRYILIWKAINYNRVTLLSVSWAAPIPILGNDKLIKSNPWKWASRLNQQLESCEGGEETNTESLVKCPETRWSSCGSVKSRLSSTEIYLNFRPKSGGTRIKEREDI